MSRSAIFYTRKYGDSYRGKVRSLFQKAGEKDAHNVKDTTKNVINSMAVYLASKIVEVAKELSSAQGLATLKVNSLYYATISIMDENIASSAKSELLKYKKKDSKKFKSLIRADLVFTPARTEKIIRYGWCGKLPSGKHNYIKGGPGKVSADASGYLSIVLDIFFKILAKEILSVNNNRVSKTDPNPTIIPGDIVDALAVSGYISYFRNAVVSKGGVYFDKAEYSNLGAFMGRKPPKKR